MTIENAGPMATLQDTGRPGMLSHGISASGPMDRAAYVEAGALLGIAGATSIECAAGRFSLTVDAPVAFAAAGGAFHATCNGSETAWPCQLSLSAGDRIEITPGSAGNYFYLRFNRELDVPIVLGSRSTNLAVGLGGIGRALRGGDHLSFGGAGSPQPSPLPLSRQDGPIRVVWGLHADVLPRETLEGFSRSGFVVSPRLDRMGVRLTDSHGVFAGLSSLSLVSDAIVPGDIQVLGDGTPIVLMRDHQPTGGYPRIATIVSADFDRFAQIRPGTEVRFQPVTLEHAR
ncbi:MAG: biotin-dependent carboxyltransferase family protein [Devosia sp.]